MYEFFPSDLNERKIQNVSVVYSYLHLCIYKRRANII